MGILSKLFGRPSAASDAAIQHPILGSVRRHADYGWVAAETGLEIGRPCLESGEQAVPSSESERAALCARFAELLRELKPQLASCLFDLYENYHSEGGGTLEDKEAIWSTARLHSIGVDSAETIVLSYTFDWQDAGDDHVVSVYVEKGKVAGASIDG